MQFGKPDLELACSSSENLSLEKPLSEHSMDDFSESSQSNGGEMEVTIRKSTDASNLEAITTPMAPVSFATTKPSINVQDFSEKPRNAKQGKKEREQAHSRLNDHIDLTLNNVFGRINREQFHQYLKEPKYLKVFNRQPRVKQFRRLFLAQELRLHASDLTSSSSTTLSTLSENSDRAVWATKFSRDGKYMATGGKDCTLRVWKVIASPLERNDLSSATAKPQAKRISMRVPPSPTVGRSVKEEPEQPIGPASMDLYAPVFHPLPFRIYLSLIHILLYFTFQTPRSWSVLQGYP